MLCDFAAAVLWDRCRDVARGGGGVEAVRARVTRCVGILAAAVKMSGTGRDGRAQEME